MMDSPSYASCLRELAEHGLGPLAQRRRVVRITRGEPVDIFAKSFATPTQKRSTDGFGGLLDELCAFRDGIRDRAARARARQKHRQEFAKALRVIDDLYKSYTAKPVVVPKTALPGHEREVIAKAFHMLQHGDLRADQRGRLLIALSNLADRAFSKAHPMVDRIDDIKAKLDAALASGHAGRAEPLICEALALIRSGRVEGADHARLSLLLSVIRQEIEEAHNDSKG